MDGKTKKRLTKSKALRDGPDSRFKLQSFKDFHLQTEFNIQKKNWDSRDITRLLVSPCMLMLLCDSSKF